MEKVSDSSGISDSCPGCGRLHNAHPFIFILLGGTRSLRMPSLMIAEACLTGWPNARPQGRD